MEASLSGIVEQDEAGQSGQPDTVENTPPPPEDTRTERTRQPGKWLRKDRVIPPAPRPELAEHSIASPQRLHRSWKLPEGSIQWQQWLRKKWIVLPGIVCVLVLVLVVSVSTTLASFQQRYSGRIYPNISIRGVPVGGMTTESARATLEARYNDFFARPVRLTYDQHTWTPGFDELGVQVEVDASIQQAIDSGRKHATIQNLREIVAIWHNGLEIPLRLTIDKQVMQSYIMKRAKEIERPTVDARLVLERAVPVAMPSISGRQVLISETMQDMLAALQTLEPQAVVVRTHELLPRLHDGDVSAAQHVVDRMLEAPLILKARGESWEWERDELARMVRVRRVATTEGTGDELMIDIDATRLRKHLQEIDNATGYGGTHPRVDWNGGNLRITREGKAMRRIDQPRAERLIIEALNAGEHTVKLPFHETSSAISQDNLHELGITDLIAVGRSDFTGSAEYRITNIIAGMKLLDDILVAPGEEFSFNEAVGSINAANGFVEGYAIIQNRTQLEWGGGICQDSTTLFRAAFWAGLPFKERWGHSFYISWYDRYGYGDYGDGPGMDATIFTGGPDLRFVNDTGNWILLQTNVNVENTVAEVLIYGKRPDRTIELEGPRIFDRTPAPWQPVFVANPDIPRGTRYQSDKARGGMSIAFTRVIKEQGAEVRRDEFLTVFKPWPNIYEVNPVDMPYTPPPPRQPVASDAGTGAGSPTPKPSDGTPVPDATSGPIGEPPARAQPPSQPVPPPPVEEPPPPPPVEEPPPPPVEEPPPPPVEEPPPPPPPPTEAPPPPPPPPTEAPAPPPPPPPPPEPVVGGSVGGSTP